MDSDTGRCASRRSGLLRTEPSCTVSAVPEPAAIAMTHNRKLNKYAMFIRYAAGKAETHISHRFNYARRIARSTARQAERAGA